MDIRDVFSWAKKARQRAWARRVDMYNAALLPYQKADAVKDTMDALGRQGLEFAYGDEVESVDRENAERMKQVKERRAAARSRPRTKIKKRSRHSKVRRLK